MFIFIFFCLTQCMIETTNKSCCKSHQRKTTLEYKCWRNEPIVCVHKLRPTSDGRRTVQWNWTTRERGGVDGCLTKWLNGLWQAAVIVTWCKANTSSSILLSWLQHPAIFSSNHCYRKKKLFWHFPPLPYINPTPPPWQYMSLSNKLFDG